MTRVDVLGHEAVWHRLGAALAADRLPHALLFAGPPGIGKSLLARRLMARIACRGDAPPCGECPGCCQIAAGTHPDLLVVSLAAPRRDKDKARKEIGIDQARELKRFVQLHAVASPRKMAIVDDADRLSLAAQNALLKTLEEPPGHAVIVLVTASPGMLLPTVRSRCQRIVLRPLADDDVRAVLVRLGVEAAEADALTAQADGSPGRALALRRSWGDAERREVLGLLADLDPARYVTVLAMSTGLGRTEQEMAARLEGLLALCHADAVAAAGAGGAGLETPLRRAALAAEALATLRRRNPNRPLLAEALALRLARD